MRAPSTGLHLKLIMAFSALLAWCVYHIWQTWSAFPPDLSALYMAGYVHSEGMYDLIYARPSGFFGGTPREWISLLPKLGLSGEYVLPYVYPPLWAGVLSPAAGALSPQEFFRAAALVQIPMMAGSVFLAWRLVQPVRMALWGWVAISTLLLTVSMVSYFAIEQLQPQILVTFVTLAAFERYVAGKSRIAGLLLAVAAALKLAPAALVVIFLLDRNWAAFRFFAITLFALVGISLILMGPQLHFDFVDSLGIVSGGVFITSVNYSVTALMHGIGIELQQFQNWVDLSGRNIRLDATEPVVMILSKVLLALLVVATVWRTRALAPRPRLVARLFAISALISMFGPLSWVHYFLPQLFLLPALPGLIGTRAGATCIVLFGVLTSVPAYFALLGSYTSDLPVMAVGTCTMLVLAWMVTSKPAKRRALAGDSATA